MTAVATVPKVEHFKQVMVARRDRFEALLPPHYSVERLMTGALCALQANPDLVKCSDASILTSLARVAQWGLDIGVTAHLVPFGTTCTAIADYKGLIKLIVQAGARNVEAHVVRAGEAFEYAFGTEPYLRHQPNSDRTKPIVAAYAIVYLRPNGHQIEVMGVEDIEKIRAKSQQWNARKEPVLPGWYARKTVIRQVAKYVPQTPALEAALAHDTLAEEAPEAAGAPDPALIGRTAEDDELDRLAARE